MVPKRWEGRRDAARACFEDTEIPKYDLVTATALGGIYFGWDETHLPFARLDIFCGAGQQRKFDASVVTAALPARAQDHPRPDGSCAELGMGTNRERIHM